MHSKCFSNSTPPVGYKPTELKMGLDFFKSIIVFWKKRLTNLS